MRGIWLLAVASAMAPVWSQVTPGRDVLVAWPEAPAAVVPLLEQVGAKLLITTGGAATSAARKAGIVTLLETGQGAEAALKAAKAQGYDGVFLTKPEGAAALAKTGAIVWAQLGEKQLGLDVRPAVAVVKEGLWPGIHPVDTTRASGTEKVWVDANLWVYAYLKGIYPQRAAILGYRADKAAGVEEKRSLGFPSLAAALAEARVSGGNVVLAPPENYRRALLGGEARAKTAWEHLAKLAKFLEAQEAAYRAAMLPSVAVLAADLEQAGELLNMAYRNNLFPVAMPVEGFNGQAYTVVAASGVTPTAGVQAKLKARAAGGSTVAVAPGAEGGQIWWKEWMKEKRPARAAFSLYGLGKGHVAAYADPVIDPSEFALDLMEMPGMAVRPLRLWNAGAVLGMVRQAGAGRWLVTLVNYGSPKRDITMMRVAGHWAGAVALRPGMEAKPLETRRRGATTEVDVPTIEQTITIELTAEGRKASTAK